MSLPRWSWVCTPLLVAGIAGCKSSTKSAASHEAYRDIETTFDDSEPPPAQKKPVEGADLTGLNQADIARFDKLVDRLPSPCGKAHSLRTSRNTDESCTKSTFAIEWVVQLLRDGANNKELQDAYDERFGDKDQKQHTFVLEGTPYVGPSDAMVKMVEFFDYGCPACAAVKPVIEEVIAKNPSDVVVYYKMFPLASHPNSRIAAQAALAAHQQGKFKEMDKLLFANQQAHTMADLRRYAESLGLDMTKFESDFAAAAARVEADRQEGDKAEVHGTPSMFINGRSYEGPEHPKYYQLAIRTELATLR